MKTLLPCVQEVLSVMLLIPCTALPVHLLNIFLVFLLLTSVNEPSANRTDMTSHHERLLYETMLVGAGGDVVTTRPISLIKSF